MFEYSENDVLSVFELAVSSVARSGNRAVTGMRGISGRRAIPRTFNWT
jgi:hypothetical protein